jgi:FK506-binding protein 1
MSLLRFGLVAAVAHAQCVTKQLISAGDGVTFPKAGDTVSMHYTGTLASTGAKFDSSKDRGKEFSTQIGVGQVIQGWDQGVPQMSLGEHAILRISAACGYGARGSPPDIPPGADLVFDVELNGLNGRRAGATSVAAFPAFSPAPAAPVAPASSNLPRCIPSNCGHAISFDGTGNTRPLCLCNPMCQLMAGTPGVLPCCPGLQEVCLDPHRESPTPKPVAPPAPVHAFGASLSATSNVGAFGLTASTRPAVLPAANPMMPATANTFLPAANAMLPAASALPTCRPNSCGMGMASGVNSMTAVCACDASCLAPNSALPCCQSFSEVCQSGLTAPAQQFAPQPGFAAGGSASVSCALGRTLWAEQASCDKKRWAIQNGKCKKSCPAVDAQTNSGLKFWATGTVGKNACAAALAACSF